MFALSVCIRVLRPPSEIPKGAVRPPFCVVLAVWFLAGDRILAKQVCREAKRNIESPLRNVGAPPYCFVLSVCFLRGVEDVAPYNKWGGFGAPPYCFVLSVCFLRGVGDVAPYGLTRECGSTPSRLFLPFVFSGDQWSPLRCGTK